MMSGSVIGQRYQIGRTIGVGGMGFVYEAVDLQTGVEVALKALPPGAPDPIRVRRLRREAAAATAVRSERVCRVHYLGVERGTPFIVMERLHGHTLRTRLDTYGPPPLAEAVAIVVQLLDALIATHAAGIIHRDIKPSNVFLAGTPDDSPSVKLIDFGLAKITAAGELNQRDERRDEITTVECMLGTLQYLAPEHLLGVGELDERSDVYAAGLTLFETLTGQRAFKGSYAEIVHDIILGELPRASDWRSDLPAVMDDVLAMAMAKTRDRRFASAHAFKRALLAALHYGEIKESGVCPVIDDPSGELQRPGVASSARRPPPVPSFKGVASAPADDAPTIRPPPPGFDEDEPTIRYTAITGAKLRPPRSNGG
jgi:serine/threonine protein kinase